MESIIKDFMQDYGYKPTVYELFNACSNGMLLLTDKQENELLKYFEANGLN